MINIKENIKNVEEFNLLYDDVGWGAYDDNITQKALDNTFLYIQDIMVKPEYQGNKIGTMIMNKLLEKINEIKQENPDLRVYLGASKNREEFYEKFGFIKRIDADLGYGMILNKYKEIE